jgi:hypothetical protein
MVPGTYPVASSGTRTGSGHLLYVTEPGSGINGPFFDVFVDLPSLTGTRPGASAGLSRPIRS